MLNSSYPAIGVLILGSLASLSSVARAEEPAPQAERFTGTVVVVNAPKGGFAQIRITIERWTTEEERKKLAEAIGSAGTDALVKAMDGMKVGYVQIENNLRWPVRVASSWTTDKGRLLRFATNRPIDFVESWDSTRSVDYPIGVVQLLLPPEGTGEGALLVATQVKFDADGRLVVKSLPLNMGPQQIVDVRSEIVPPKKKK